MRTYGGSVRVPGGKWTGKPAEKTGSKAKGGNAQDRTSPLRSQIKTAAAFIGKDGGEDGPISKSTRKVHGYPRENSAGLDKTGCLSRTAKAALFRRPEVGERHRCVYL